MSKNNRWREIFKIDEGKVVVAQWPNWQLMAALGLYLLSLMTEGDVKTVSVWGGRVFLLYWAILEITQGVNTWRKLLGVMVAVGVAYSILS